MLTDEQVKKEKLERERQEAIVVTYTEGDYEFKIKGKDYKEVLSKLCNFLNGDLDFPYTFTVEQHG
jgi:hypothetical protein